MILGGILGVAGVAAWLFLLHTASYSQTLALTDVHVYGAEADVTPALRALIETALAEGVSFAVRGNLLLLAPPLVIKEDALAGALALLGRLLTRFFSDPPTESAP